MSIGCNKWMFSNRVESNRWKLVSKCRVLLFIRPASISCCDNYSFPQVGEKKKRERERELSGLSGISSPTDKTKKRIKPWKRDEIKQKHGHISPEISMFQPQGFIEYNPVSPRFSRPAAWTCTQNQWVDLNRRFTLACSIPEKKRKKKKKKKKKN